MSITYVCMAREREREREREGGSDINGQLLATPFGSRAVEWPGKRGLAGSLPGRSLTVDSGPPRAFAAGCGAEGCAGRMVGNSTRHESTGGGQ